MTTLAMPGNMMISIHHSLKEITLIPARQILEVPTQITGIFDGTESPQPGVQSPYIMFSTSWHREFAGHGFEEINQMLLPVAARLAAMDDRWPSSAAHVRALPVIDTRFSYIITPYWTPPQPDRTSITADLAEKLASQLEATEPDVAAKLRELAKPSDCDCCRTAVGGDQ